MVSVVPLVLLSNPVLAVPVKGLNVTTVPPGRFGAVVLTTVRVAVPPVTIPPKAPVTVNSGEVWPAKIVKVPGLTVMPFRVALATDWKVIDPGPVDGTEAEPVVLPVPVAVTPNVKVCAVALVMLSVEVLPLIDVGLNVAVAVPGTPVSERFAVPSWIVPAYLTVTV